MYTAKDKAGMVTVLRYVAERLKDENEFICILADFSSVATKRDRSRVVELIRGRLGDQTTLEGWVVHNLPKPLWKNVLEKSKYGSALIAGNYNRSFEQMRRYRLRWVEELIREFS